MTPKSVREARAAQAAEFYRETYDAPARFREHVRNLLMLNYPREASEVALRALHPLSRSNARGGVVHGLAAGWGIPVVEVFEHFKTLPLERQNELNAIIDEETDEARKDMLEEILAAEPTYTEKLREYERGLRCAVFQDVPEFITARQSCWLILELYDALNLKTWGMRVPQVLKVFRGLKPDQKQQIRRIAAEALTDPTRDVAAALRAGMETRG